MDREKRLAEFLRTNVLKDSRVVPSRDTPLVSSGLVDSLSLIQVLAFVEDEFQVAIPDEAATAEAMNTIGGILALVDVYGDHR
jgi:acyl carrier protein